METLKKVLSQTSWQLLGKIISSVSTIFILSLITRNYGQSGTGVFTLILTYLNFFFLGVDLGLNAYILPKLDKRPLLLGELLGFRLVWSMVLVVLALMIANFFTFADENFLLGVLIGVLTIVANGVYNSANIIFQKNLRYDLSVVASSAGAVVFLALVYLLSASHLGVGFLLVGFLASWLLTAVLAVIFLKQIIFVDFKFPNFDFIKSYILPAWPISLTLFLNVVYFRVDAFLLTFFYSFKEVGVYNLAYQFFQTALVLPTFIMNGYYPLMIKRINEDYRGFLKQLKMGVIVLLTMAVAGSMITFWSAEFFINLVAGKGFEGSVLVLQILGSSFPAFFVSSLLMWTLVSLKRYKTVLTIYGLGLVANFVLNLWLIPLFSYIGASIVTVISEYLILILEIIILIPLRRLSNGTEN